MTVFVSYQPGAKGNFIAEICDLGIVPGAYKILNYSTIEGNRRWLDYAMESYLLSHKISRGSYHGVMPEEENYKFYIDTLIDAFKFTGSKFSPNIHYTEVASLEYILSKGEKVVRIITATKEHAAKLKDNFFYKNFIKKDSAEQTAMAKHVITTTETPLKENFDYTVFKKPLKEWDKNSIKVLYDICALSTVKLQEPNVIKHSNLLEVHSNELASIDVLASIVEFAGGTMNDVVRHRIDEYNAAQEEITTFDEYMNVFLNNR